MLIFTSHNLNDCFESRGTRSWWNVFEGVQKTRSTFFIGSKNTRLRLVSLTPIKHSCLFFKHYIINKRLLRFVFHMQHGPLWDLLRSRCIDLQIPVTGQMPKTTIRLHIDASWSGTMGYFKTLLFSYTIIILKLFTINKRTRFKIAFCTMRSDECLLCF